MCIIIKLNSGPRTKYILKSLLKSPSLPSLWCVAINKLVPLTTAMEQTDCANGGHKIVHWELPVGGALSVRGLPEVQQVCKQGAAVSYARLLE